MTSRSPKTPSLRLGWVAAALGLALLPFACSESDTPEARALKKELEEAGQAAADYASMKREDLQATLEENLADLDRTLKELKARAQTQSQQTWNRSLDRLEQERREVAEQLEELRASSGPAWESLKGGLINAYEDLAVSVQEASRQLAGDER